MGSDEATRHTLQFTIAVCRIGRVEFVLIADPLESIDMEYCVKELEVEVSWYSLVSCQYL